MKLETGKTYRTRDGKHTVTITNGAKASEYPMVGEVANVKRTWTAEGVHDLQYPKGALDLVEEVSADDGVPVEFCHPLLDEPAEPPMTASDATEPYVSRPVFGGELTLMARLETTVQISGLDSFMVGRAVAWLASKYGSPA